VRYGEGGDSQVREREGKKKEKGVGRGGGERGGEENEN